MSNNFMSNNKNTPELEQFTINGKTYVAKENATDGEKIMYAVAFGVLTCYLVPAYTVKIVLSGVALGSLYLMACIIEADKKNKDKIMFNRNDER